MSDPKDADAIDVPGEEVKSGPELDPARDNVLLRPLEDEPDDTSPERLAAGPTLESFDRWLDENAKEWEQEARSEVVRQAELEIGPQVRGSEKVFEYWREVLPPHWSDEQVRQYSESKHWCGGFALCCIKRAGLAESATWRDGVGFVYPEGLPPTTEPKKGDVLYKPTPWQHYAIFERFDGPKVVSIDGNQPNVRRVVRESRRGLVFFSIAPFLHRAVNSEG